MDVIEAIRKRKSQRSFLEKPVEEEKLNALIDAARLAPSASNRQEWRFVIVRGEQMRRKIAHAARDQAFVGLAPVIIVACAETDNHKMMCGQLCYPINVAIALDHMSLAAIELGLGSCWIGAFDESEVKALLNIPEKVRVVELMPVGYPSENSVKEKNRLSFKDIVRYETWQQ
jgi:nitroreductase